jgi:hypothetical protein
MKHYIYSKADFKKCQQGRFHGELTVLTMEAGGILGIA